MKEKLQINPGPVMWQRVILLVALFLMIAPFGLFAQNISVKGTVKSEDGSAIPGVSVLLKGTSTATATNADGQYTISAPASGTLAFSFIGYEPLEMPISGRTQLNVTMKESVSNLQEVVVVGYGSQQKKDVTGAIATITSKEFKARPNTQFGYSLEGKLAGVQVIRPSGQPQAGFSIRVRGTSTITAGSEPLYIVDGVPTTSINDISPADIETMSILKDASAASIYGASGSNGVVLITTKRGANQKAQVTFDTYLSTAQVWKKLKVLNGPQYKDLMTEMGQTADWSMYNYDTNWQDQVFRTAHSQNYQLGINGGNENTKYYISGSWVKQEGVVMTNQLDRYTFKTNVDQKVNNWLKVGTSLNYSRWKDVEVAEDRRYQGAIVSLLTGAPVTTVYNTDGTFAINPFIQDLENPVALLLKSDHSWVNNRFSGNAFAEINLLKDLKFKTLFGYEQQNGVYNAWMNPFTSREGRGYQGVADLNTRQRTYWISENTFTYNKTIGKSNITGLAGFVASETLSSYTGVNARGFGGDAVHTVNGGATRTVTYAESQRRNAAFLGRVNYSYDDKYLLTANFRADASTVFAATNNIWGFFPSFSAGWRISKEKFFKGLDFINDMKIRAGWGAVGNDQVGDYASYGLVSSGALYVYGNTIVPGTSPITLENKNLKWETTKQTNIGIDVTLLDSRLLLTADYYMKKTTDMLLDRPIPASVGMPGNTATKNIGAMNNTGVEFQVSSRNLINTLKWNTDFNISFNKSKIVSLDGGTIKVGAISDRGSVAIAQEGEELGLFYGYIWEGVDPQTGMSIYSDLDSTGTLSDGDLTIIGNSNPKFVFGLNNSFTYGNWSFSFFIQGVQGNQIFNATRLESEGLWEETNQMASVLDRWITPGQVTNIPKATYGDYTNAMISSRFVEDGSFIRLKSMTIGYELPKNIVSKLSVSRIYLYVSSENLLTFTKYSGFDPEVSLYGRSSNNSERNIAPGVDYGTYPQTREFLFGLSVTF